MVDPSSIASLVPLFAPYCGGVEREVELKAALTTLMGGQLESVRPLNDGGGHAYVLSWRGEPAPLEISACELRFPALPEIVYSFSVPCHQLVSWLVAADGAGLPTSFWPWLLQGRIVPEGT